MADVKIECPHCKKSFKLNETLAAPLIEETRKKLQRDFEEKEEELDKRAKAFGAEEKAAEKARKALDKERDSLAKQKEQMDEQIAQQVEGISAEITREETKKAKQKFDEKLAERDVETQDLQAAIKEKDEKLAEARKAELEFLKKQRELDDKIKSADVDVQKRVGEVLGPELAKAKKEAEEESRLKLAEKDKLLADAQKQMEAMKRRIEQGSQQMQGEIQELDLERRLREAFPRDTIEPVPKGKHGGDALQLVLSPNGQVCGKILWEFKRTKNWTGTWPDKLKQDQREAKADLAVIVTQAMPQGLDTFAEVDGVWVTTPALAIPLAAALRGGLAEAFAARQAADGQQDKMAILYQYLMGPQFRQRIEAIKDAFITMGEDLDAEKRLINKQWAKRQQQIERVMISTVGMWGDLNAIAGKSLQEIQGLDLKLLAVAEDKQSENS